MAVVSSLSGSDSEKFDHEIDRTLKDLSFLKKMKVTCVSY